MVSWWTNDNEQFCKTDWKNNPNGGIKTTSDGLCTYGQSIRRLVKAKGGGQHGGADREAGAAGIAALASWASGGIPPTLPAGDLWLLLDHQDLVVAQVT